MSAHPAVKKNVYRPYNNIKQCQNLNQAIESHFAKSVCQNAAARN